MRLKDMLIRFRCSRKGWLRTKTELLSALLHKFRRCVTKLHKYLKDESNGAALARRRSHAKLHPLPDRPIRRAASKLNRKPTNEIERLRRKGDQWTANDLFRFQYSDPEEGTSEERRELCYAWLDRLQAISKKYCYLAWYEAAIYACYYRLGPILLDNEEKRRIWTDVKREYAQIFIMGRRIWRRPSHPSRLRVLYDMAVLCVRFGDIENDDTCAMFREELEDADNFDYRLMDEVQFAKSVDKVTLLENHVIDQFYVRRRSSGSLRSSFRYKKQIERTPSRKSTNAEASDCSQSLTELAIPVEQQPTQSTESLKETHEIADCVQNLALTRRTRRNRPKRPKSEILTHTASEAVESSKKDLHTTHSFKEDCSTRLRVATVPCIRIHTVDEETGEATSPQRVVHFSDEDTSSDGEA